MVGPLALVGSGEFLAEMEDTDRILLDAARPGNGQAVIVPTASALEPGMPEQWAERGIHHFRERLGVGAEAALILDREGADGRFVSLVRGASLIYFSGGDPRYLVQTMAGTAFWRAVQQAWAGGVALAGCSAGAMMLGSLLQNIVGKTGDRVSALGVVPGVTVIPHFDRIEHYRPGALAGVRAQRAPGMTLVGVDEVTAVIHVDGAWHVMGKGKVLVVNDEGETAYTAGEQAAIPSPAVSES